MSELIEARDIKEGDSIPLVGKVTQVVITATEVALTTFWSNWVTNRLAPDALVWVNRHPNAALDPDLPPVAP